MRPKKLVKKNAVQRRLNRRQEEAEFEGNDVFEECNCNHSKRDRANYYPCGKPNKKKKHPQDRWRNLHECYGKENRFFKVRNF